jgi:hypothetical protein
VEEEMIMKRIVLRGEVECEEKQEDRERRTEM